MIKAIKNDKVTKAVLIGLIALIAGLIIRFTISLATTGPEYLKDQVVDGISFEDATLNIDNGVSTYSVMLVNDLKSDYALKNVSITFKDTSGKEIITLLGYVGETIKSEEIKYLDTSVDMELTNIGSITYTINK